MVQQGAKNNPFSYAGYQTMQRSNVWEGGWVKMQDLSIIYITASNQEERDNINGELGEQANPFSHEAYTEMCVKRMWEGGYAKDQNGITRYYREGGETDASGCGCGSSDDCASGEGCGSGSGEGCGCGSVVWEGGLIAGEEKIRPASMPANKEVTITWGGGTFSQFGNPSLSASLQNSSTGNSSTVSALWESPYRVAINATIRELVSGSYQLIPYTVYYDIPYNYRY